MSLLSENLDHIKKTNYLLFQVLEKSFSSVDALDDSVVLCTDKTGNINIKVRKNDKEFYIHSNYNAYIEAERWAESVNIKSELIVVLGLGLGYHIEALLKVIDKNRRVCVIEPDIRVFKHFLENRSIVEIFDTRVTVICNENSWNVAQELYGVFKERLLDSIEFRIYSNYSQIYERFFAEAQKGLADIVRTLTVNVSTGEYFKEIWTINFLVNSFYLNGSANGKVLQNKFKGIPAIIVSAGPSLSKNIHLLKEIKDKAVIIAGGSAIGILNKHGIKPHFIVAMDGDPLEKDIFIGIDFKDISLIYINRLYYEISQEYNGRKFTFIDENDKFSMYLDEYLGLEFQIMESDQTVGGLNIGIAKHLGCNPITFIGQDLAYPNLQMHAEGAAHMQSFEEEFNQNSSRFIKTKDIYGKDIYTIKQFLTSKMIMERKINEAKKDGFEYINATEGGIGLSNCENIDFNDVISKYITCTHEIDRIIAESFNKGLFKKTSEEIKGFYEHLDTEINDIKESASELYDNCLKIKKILESKKTNSKEYPKLAFRVNDIQMNIEKNKFYNKFLMGSLEQTISIHKIIMEKELSTASNQIQKNVIRIKFITNQALEIIGMCNFIKYIEDNYLDKLFELSTTETK